jgi:polar amino acid transport system substrate-binding protein
LDVSALLVAGSAFAFAADFKIMTEEYPPFNYTEDGKLTGLASDVMVEMTRRCNCEVAESP